MGFPQVFLKNDEKDCAAVLFFMYGGFMKELYRKHKEIILYAFFGAATTAVNFIVTFVIQKVFGLAGEGVEFTITNTIAWVCAVAFAYVTSHLYVFESKAHGAKAITVEAAKFVGSRIFTGIIEMLMPTGLVALGVTGSLFSFKGFWAKAITGVVVIILNYVLSKLFVFRKKSDAQAEEPAEQTEEPAGKEQVEENV